MTAAPKIAAGEKFAISFVGSEFSNDPRLTVATWPEFVAMFAAPRQTPCTRETCGKGEHQAFDYKTGKPKPGCRHKSGRAWIPATFASGRENDTCRQLCMLVIDGDHIDDDKLETLLAKLEKYQYLAHPSHSDKTGNRCVRIAIPLSVPVRGEAWPLFWPTAMAFLDMPVPADPACKNSSRLYFLPSRPSDADYWVIDHPGDPLDVAELEKLVPPRAPSVADSIKTDENGKYGPGCRHAYLVSMAGACRKRGDNEEMIFRHLAISNENCEPPKPESELRDIAKWAAKKAREEAWRTDDMPPDPDAAVEQNTPRYHRCPDLVARILARAKEPWIELRIGDAVIAKLRLGSVAMLTGAPGTGKSTLAIALAREHIASGGVVIYLSLELDADELGARLVGMTCDASWIEALQGLPLLDAELAQQEMARALDLPGFAILDGDDATIGQLESTIAAMRSTFPSAPILVVADYLQIMPGDEREVRTRVAAAAQTLRRAAKRLGIVILGISQPSRAAGKALSAGEMLGAETMTAMAETAEIERAAYVTLAIGAHQPEREDGTRLVDLSIGKGRMGGGDRVIPMSYLGRSGVWRADGEARPASVVKSEREMQRSTERVSAAKLAMITYADRAKEAVTREDLRRAARCNREIAGEAVEQLLDEHELTEVRLKKPRARDWRVWTPGRAEAAGVAVIDREEP